MSLIIFDMDGVIVNVSGSYREAARRTAATFFSLLDKAETLPSPLFALEDVAYVKQSGGLNNDWDLTYKLIDLLANVLTTETFPESTADLSAISAEPLALYLKARPEPLKRLYHEYPEPNGMFAQFYTGDVGDDNVIKQIFQEIYLGQILFQDTYGLLPQYVFAPGLIDTETLFLNPDFFRELAKRHTLAIATGRPLNEALYPLEKHNMRDFFKMLLAHDDCESAAARHRQETGETCSFGKPHPYMLDAISAQIEPDTDKRYFVGDMPDDMLAAKRSSYGFTAVGVTYAGKDAENTEKILRHSKADVICKSVKELEDFLLKSI